ncbi:uncharacterized protein TRUGW13939_04968 [Talaromyces rugulosus]|uniref:Uncharacterized protein n=1 Tax=Talaromyces rugulosus TaxID=121627 RepID=A0A7H8QVZ9_TALRU|nr:uncharacterized protein TRUGW13939_04968 [Talaromyces rugulosus]QKX57848.1 hypothetical protein TRUGW13939_04968 [Talaromyces rugulosus]
MPQPAEHPVLDHIALRREWDRQLEEAMKQIRERALSHQSNQHHNNPQHAQNRQQTGENQQDVDADSPNSQ